MQSPPKIQSAEASSIAALAAGHDRSLASAGAGRWQFFLLSPAGSADAPPVWLACAQTDLLNQHAGNDNNAIMVIRLLKSAIVEKRFICHTPATL